MKRKTDCKCSPPRKTATANAPPIGDYSRKGKGGQGNIAINTGERNGDLVAATLVAESDDLMFITSGGVLSSAPRSSKSAKPAALQRACA